VVTFGFNAQADVRAVNLTLQGRRGAFRHRAAGRGHGDRGLHPADAGRSQRLERAGRRGRGAASGHEAEIREALAGFGGVNRRFTKVGEVAA
jgi:UDP-N-acetylmuramate--alanine ligase